MGENKNYIVVKDRHPRISEVLNDCVNLCVPTYKGEPLSSILQKICNKISNNTPYNFVDSDTLEWSVSGNNVSANVIGGGGGGDTPNLQEVLTEGDTANLKILLTNIAAVPAAPVGGGLQFYYRGMSGANISSWINNTTYNLFTLRGRGINILGEDRDIYLNTTANVRISPIPTGNADRLIGQISSSGDLEYVDIGTGLDLTGGVLSTSATVVNLYNNDGTLAGIRTVDMDGYSLEFENNGLFRVSNIDTVSAVHSLYNNAFDTSIYDADKLLNINVLLNTGILLEATDIGTGDKTGIHIDNDILDLYNPSASTTFFRIADYTSQSGGEVLTLVDPLTGEVGWTAISGGSGGTVTSVDITQPAAGITATGGPITVSGSITLALADDLAAVESLNTTGIVRRTAADTWSAGGTVDISEGGTGLTSLGTANQILRVNSGATALEYVNNEIPISDLLAATSANTINNAGYSQVWQWNGLLTSSPTGLSLQSNNGYVSSTKLFEVILTGPRTVNGLIQGTQNASLFYNNKTSFDGSYTGAINYAITAMAGIDIGRAHAINAQLLANSEGSAIHIMNSSSDSNSSALSIESTSGIGIVTETNVLNSFGLDTDAVQIVNIPTALVDIGASTTTRSSLRIREGVAPSSPNDGDIWHATDHLYTRLNGVTYQLDQQGGGTVNSVSGTANRITSTGGSNPVIDISASYVGQSSITTLGTITTGTWNGTSIGPTFGGTGQTTYATGDILYASAANTLSKLAAGTDGHVLTLASGVPTWAAPSGGSSITFGTDNQIPYTNATGDDFDYSSGFTFNGTALTVNSGADVNAPNALIVATSTRSITIGPGSNNQGMIQNTGVDNNAGITLRTRLSVDMGVFTRDIVYFQTNNVDRLRIGLTELVFNEPGNNYDLRVEGDTEVNLFFVDASADNIGVKTNTPQADLHVAGDVRIDGGLNLNGSAITGYIATSRTVAGTTDTLLATDTGNVIYYTSGTAVTLTVPTGLPAGFNCTIVQLGAGAVTFTPSSTTINNRQSFTSTAGQYAVASIHSYTTDTFVTGGDMA